MAEAQSFQVAGQEVTVLNESANTITFAAVGTSNVADGATTAIPANTSRTFFYNAGAATPAWYRLTG